MKLRYISLTDEKLVTVTVLRTHKRIRYTRQW